VFGVVFVLDSKKLVVQVNAPEGLFEVRFMDISLVMVSTRVRRDLAQEIGRRGGRSIPRLAVCKRRIEQPSVNQDDLVKRGTPDRVDASIGAVGAFEAEGSCEVNLGEDGVVESV